MKVIFRRISFLPGLLLALAALPSCSTDSEKDLAQAFSPAGSPYHFMAYFTDSRNDTTARYKMELQVIGEKSNVEGEDGNYSISFNTADAAYNTRWKIISLGLPPDTIIYEGKIDKDGKSVSLEMPEKGVFAPLRHTLGVTASENDKEGKVSITNFTTTGKSGEGLQKINAKTVVKKVEDQDWNGSAARTWFYETTTQHGDFITNTTYRYTPDHGFLRIDHVLPGKEKITILQVPKKGASAQK